MDDRNYQLQCGHEFCLFCLERQSSFKKPSCNTCSQPIGIEDKNAIWRKTHCTWCDNWMSGSYGQLCENCYFEKRHLEDQDEALRSAVPNDVGMQQEKNHNGEFTASKTR